MGGKRIGVAAATLEAGLARPLTTLQNDDNIFAEIERVINQENAGTLIVGLPRGLEGQATEQTKAAEGFAEELRRHFSGLTINLQDEAVTSKQAEAELEGRGKPYRREDIDSLAATYILDDWLAQRREREAAG